MGSAQGVPVSCPTCDKEFCSLCSATWHPGLSCAEHGAALVIIFIISIIMIIMTTVHQVKRGGEPVDPFFLPDNCNDNIKRCPMCSVPIERDAGCAQVITRALLMQFLKQINFDGGFLQMMCKRCKHVFCWYCLTSLDVSIKQQTKMLMVFGAGVFTMLMIKDDFLLRHYDSGDCQGKLGHSRASVIWHRAQVPISQR